VGFVEAIGIGATGQGFPSEMNLPSQPAPADLGAIVIRHCHGLAEYEQCVELERVVFGDQITVPSAIFVVAEHTGGQVLGAFDGSRMIGFTLALSGHHGSKPFLHSHMTGVLADYRDRGIGRQLKEFQRRDALKNGLDLVEWTFDPLEFRNAHLNFMRLGAVARRFVPNCYGITDSELHGGLPTDRLIAEWWLDSPRVRGIMAAGASATPVADSTAARVISVPAAFAQQKSTDRESAARTQTRVRGELQELFHNGYVATAMRARGDAMEYILQSAASIAGLRLPEYRPEEFED
jgi:predicted GNAT superfamily acetyltransferase